MLPFVRDAEAVYSALRLVTGGVTRWLPMRLRNRTCPWLAACLTVATIANSAQGQSQPQTRADELEQAIGLVKNGEFEEAEAKLRALVQREPGNDIAELYLAIAILRQEEAAGAPSIWHAGPRRQRMREVERRCTHALELNDRLVAARIARAIALEWLEEWPSARADLLQARKNLSPASGSDQAPAPGSCRSWLALLLGEEGSPASLPTTEPSRSPQERLVDDLLKRAKRELKPLDLTFRLGPLYDTNVPQIGQGVVVPRDFGRRRDCGADAGTDFVLRPYVGDRIETGIGGGTSATWHTHLNEFDEQNYRGNAYVRLRATDWLDVGLRYDYDFNLLDRQDYLSRHRLTPQVSVFEDFWGRTTLYYQFEPRHFFPVPVVLSTGPFDQTGDVNTVGVTQGLVLGRLFGRDVLFEIGYRHEDVSTSGSEYDSRNEVLIAGVTTPLPWDVTFGFAGEWAWDRCRHRDILDRYHRRREDLVQTYVFTLTKKINEHLQAQGQILWIDDDSNVLTRQREAVFSYERVVYGVSLVASF